MESFQYSGVWWLPDNPETKVSGIVSFSQEKGIELELIGSFENFQMRNDLPDYPIIIGVPISGKEITLHDCIMVNRTSSGLSQELGGSCKFKVHDAYIGVHLTSEEDLNFDRVSIMYTHLTDWIVRRSGLKTEFSRDLSDTFKKVITYEYPEDIKAETTKGNISLGFSVYSKNGRHSYSVEEKARIDVENFGSKTLSEIRRELINPLGNLISFLTDKYNFVEKLYLSSKNLYIERDSEQIEESIEVYYSQVFYRSNESLHPMDMILYYEKIADDLPVIFESWLRSSEDLDAVFNAYFWLQGPKQLSLQERFLMLIRAIEVYHRRRKANEVLSREEHKRKKEEIISNVPEEHKQWLKEKLAFSNEPTLKNRLKDLIEESVDLFTPLVEDKDDFIKLVGDTRNYYTHYSESLKDKAASGEELFELSEKLLFLLKFCILKEIGITKEKQVDIFSSNGKYIFAKSKVEAITKATTTN